LLLAVSPTFAQEQHHSSTSTVPFQTYSPLEFDTTGLFGAGANDTTVMSHEVAEWANDPFGDNPTPAWGGTGQVPVGFCQNNLEVGDPLTGNRHEFLSHCHG
jgi:hypothetical protein